MLDCACPGARPGRTFVNANHCWRRAEERSGRDDPNRPGKWSPRRIRILSSRSEAPHASPPGVLGRTPSPAFSVAQSRRAFARMGSAPSQRLKAVKIRLVQGVAHQAQHRDVDHNTVDLDRAQALDLSERRPVLLSQRLLAVTAAFERKAVLARAYQRNERPREPAALSGLCGRGEL